MAKFSLDRSSLNHLGTSTVCLSDDTTCVTVRTSAQVVAGGVFDKAQDLRISSGPAAPALGEFQIRFDQLAESVSFTIVAADTIFADWENTYDITALDADGHQAPVIFSAWEDTEKTCYPDAAGDDTPAKVHVTVAEPIMSLKVVDKTQGAGSACSGFGIDELAFESATGKALGDNNAFDILNLIGADVDFIQFDSGEPGSGVVAFANGQTIAFSEIDRVVPCFTPGTAIATPKGEVAVETLKPGDRVLTRDNGIQTISWVGTKRLDFAQLKAAPQLRPIKITAGALGDDMPERDMLVSPSHRMLIVSHQAELYFSQSEVLVAAQHMLSMDGVEVSEQPYITYIHIMCENHEIVLSDGAWSESFQPADITLKGFDGDQRAELFALFPELETPDGVAAYRAARRTLGRREAKLLFKG